MGESAACKTIDKMVNVLFFSTLYSGTYPRKISSTKVEKKIAIPFHHLQISIEKCPYIASY